LLNPGRNDLHTGDILHLSQATAGHQRALVGGCHREGPATKCRRGWKATVDRHLHLGQCAATCLTASWMSRTREIRACRRPEATSWTRKWVDSATMGSARLLWLRRRVVEGDFWVAGLAEPAAWSWLTQGRRDTLD